MPRCVVHGPLGAWRGRAHDCFEHAHRVLIFPEQSGMVHPTLTKGYNRVMRAQCARSAAEA